MAAPLRWNTGHFGVKAESVPFTEEGVLVGDMMLAEDVLWDPDIEMIERNDIHPYGFGKLASLTGAQKASISFGKVYFRGGASAGAAGVCGPLLKACGWSETVVGATSVTYKPASSSAAPYTAQIYRDGWRYSAKGCFGNFTLTFDAGKPVIMAGSFTGSYVAPTNAALLAPTYDAVTPLFARAMALTYDGITYEVQKFVITNGATPTYIDDLNGATGIKGTFIANRRLSGSISVSAQAPGTHNPFTKMISGVTFAISSGAIGSGAGGILTITQATCRARSVKPANVDGRIGFEIDFEQAVVAGAAEGTDMSLVWT